MGDNNMIWSVNQNGTITSAFSGKCFQADDLDGGYLSTCSESKDQRWVVRGTSGKQQIASAAGKFIRRGAPPQPPRPPQPVGELVFDVTSLGWTTAQVRDLWSHQDLGAQSKITVRLSGDGDSRLFKLTKAPEQVI